MAIVVITGSIGEPDLMLVGLFLCVLPVLSLLLVLALHPRLSYERSIHPSTIPVGAHAEAVVRLENTNPVAATTLQVNDLAPASVGSGARFVVARAFGRWDQPVRYPIEATKRGRFLIGPLEAVAGDPLGLATMKLRPLGEETLLRVTPRIWPLPDAYRGLGVGATGESSPQRAGQAGQDDVLVREHRHGDDIRRVHWRMSAKQGELMVRLEEHPWDPSALVIADTRRSSHVGEGPDASLEWVISAAASVSVKFSSDRYRIVVAGGSGTLFHPQQAGGVEQREALVDAMTDAGPSEETALSAILEESDSLDATGTIVAITGALLVADAATLVSIGQRLAKPCALVPAARAWGMPTHQHEDAIRLLERSGWAVETYGPGEPLPKVWARLMVRQARA